ncbi:MAG: DUF359 domain-containing protein [Thermoplasmata archaeon]|nr:MAG: DUF359 domain-containing protein [Thermoplasmata archaeon]
MPDDLRDELKNPLGEVVLERELSGILRHFKKVVSVGDQCSFTLFKMGFTPDIAVVDYMVQRNDVGTMREQIEKIGQIVINVKNPPGVLTKDLWNAVKSAYQREEKVRIEVDGEEDLATLPGVWLAPEKTAVVYGLPNIGLVLVKDEDDAKMKVKNVLTHMN